ncbi:OB-fold putative lipoprotein [Pseudomonas sp. B21-040]|uniref:OB-fold putative lipoprotein n=1 Tax=unclassified Pseudomonas TaxID=196821 RepID=UPI001CBC323C|nr:MULTISPECIES: OB-fold putative lipoprotein [unclassified Pseudomonas]UVL42500.1 OB-fold putative lipoprotein [Pseudomonas sp. B21-040]
MNEAVAVAAPHKRQVGFLLGLGILFFPLLFGWMLLRKGHSILSRIVGFTWMALCLVSLIGMGSISKNSYDSYKERAAQSSSSGAPPKQQAQAEPIKAYTSAKVSQDYEDNTIAADLQYKGKRVKVTGRITDINTDFLGNPYLVLAGTNQFMGPQFKFDKSDMSSLAALKKGAQISVVCTGKGDVVKTPMFEDCEVSK